MNFTFTLEREIKHLVIPHARASESTPGRRGGGRGGGAGLRGHERVAREMHTSHSALSAVCEGLATRGARPSHHGHIRTRGARGSPLGGVETA